jgi:transposase-like protein
MKRRRWDSKTKAKIVLEGLSGRSVADICTDYQISQVQYYQWRDKLLGEAYRAFEKGGAESEVTRLRKRNARLQQIIGALTEELKKSDEELL